MASQESVVIVGAGQAGSECAFALRQQGFEGRIVLLGEEQHLPYRRPPLSKAFLAGEVDDASLLIRSAANYADKNIECLLGRRVDHIDRAAKTVSLEDGEQIPYTWLVLATGGRARPLPLAGADRPNVFSIRTLADTQGLKGAFAPGKRLVVIGGGFIGLEVAAIGIKMGLAVTVVEALPRLLARVVEPELSAYYKGAHEQRGVTVVTGVGVEALEGNDRIEAVVLADGRRLAADVVVVGIGMLPNTELAEAAGLAVNQGIVVDAAARTSDAAILAIGDCCHHENVFLGRSLRVESVPHAMEHARLAAATILGVAKSYDTVPWFWSDQFDLKLQIVGFPDGFDAVAFRGSLEKNSFCHFYLKNDRLIAAACVNRLPDFGVLKQLVAARVAVRIEDLEDETRPLKLCLPAA